MKYLWTEDTGVGLHFWKLVNQLHEEMRQAGFYLKFVEDTCEHFAIIDKEIESPQ